MSAAEEIGQDMADRLANPSRPLRPRSRRNIITNRVWAQDGTFYFRCADGSLIKPETAIRRGLVDRDAYEKALAEELHEVYGQV